MFKLKFPQTKTLKTVQIIVVFLLVFHATIFVARFINNGDMDADKTSAAAVLNGEAIADEINQERSRLGLPLFVYSDMLSRNLSSAIGNMRNSVDVTYKIFPEATKIAGVTFDCNDNVSDSIKSLESLKTPENIILGVYNRIGIGTQVDSSGCHNVQIITVLVN